MPKFSLYCLPFIAAMAYGISNFINSVGISTKLMHIDPYLEPFWMSLSIPLAVNLIPTLMMFLLFIPLFSVLKLQLVTKRNILIIILTIIIVNLFKILMGHLEVGPAFASLFHGESYFKVFNVIARMTNLLFFLLPLMLILYGARNYLDLYKETYSKDEKRWKIANLFGTMAFFNYTLWLLYPLLMLFKEYYSLMAEFQVEFWLKLPVTIMLFFLMLSNKIRLTYFNIPATFYAGITLALLTLLTSVIGESVIMLADHASIGALILLLFSVPIIAIIIICFATIKVTNYFLVNSQKPNNHWQ